ncbi:MULTISPECIES: O-antigen polymerase [Clostridium]|uniref:O-antigen polymerase n=1 Tax=Clostridium TaxID=1485 RepID=UPI000824688D|nr:MULTISPECIES: O-antigen polymerase [Clostridium]PJI08937.1 hypothetical protein CUB90_14170 [Clostridium sp. CT7]
MTLDFFYTIMSQNFGMYILIFVIVAFTYLLLLRKQIDSIFDPMLLFTLFSIGTTATNIFLYMLKYINKYFITQYILTEIAFLVGIMCIPRINIKKVKKEIDNSKSQYYFNIKKIMFVMVSLIYIVIQLYIYIKFGVPIFYNQIKKSLLDLQNEAGIFNRILTGCLPIIICIFIDNLMDMKKLNLPYKLYNSFVFIFISVTLILSGWKSNFVIIIFLCQYYLVFSYKFRDNYKLIYKKILNFSSKILIIACLFAILITGFRYTGNKLGDTVEYIFHRIAISGDIFIYSYVDTNLLYKISTGNFITNFLGNLILFKHFIQGYGSDLIKNNLGLQVFQAFYNVTYVSGPNPRHNFLGYIYFGFVGSIIFSFTIGILTSYVRNKLYYKFSSNVIGGILYATCAYYILYAHVDLFSLCLGSLDVFMIIFVIVLCASNIVYVVCIRNSHKYI